MFLLDFAVITSSLIIEIAVTNMAVVGLLVIARTWRFARVGHGVMASAEHVEELFETDPSVETMMDAFAKLPEARWDEIKKLHCATQEELSNHLTLDEMELVEEFS